jgi:hypothetical protein
VKALTIGELPDRALTNIYWLAKARAKYSAYLADVLSEEQWLSLAEWQDRATSPLPEHSHNPKNP